MTRPSVLLLLASGLSLIACDREGTSATVATNSASAAPPGHDGSAAVASATGSVAASPAVSPPAASWPALPHDAAALTARVVAETRRSEPELAPLTADTVLAGLREATRRSTLAAGWRPIAATLSRRIETPARGAGAYLLFGSFHDSPGQLDAFRRIVGPLGVAPAPLIALEQLHADGAWAGEESQAGDDALLRRYLAGGEEAALAELEQTQRERDYTAWKYGYVERVTDVVASARSAGRRLVGCDMPSALQARVRAELGEEGRILRDLHCALALRRALDEAKTGVAALFIGDAHLAAGRLARFLPAGAEVLRIHLVGERGAAAGIEQELASRLAILDPLLVPLSDTRFALLLPDGRLAVRVDRVRSSEAIDAGDRQQLVVEGIRGRAQIGAQHGELGDTTRFAAPAGPVPFLIEQARGSIAGVVDVPEGGSVTLTRETDGTLRVHVRTPGE